MCKTIFDIFEQLSISNLSLKFGDIYGIKDAFFYLKYLFVCFLKKKLLKGQWILWRWKVFNLFGYKCIFRISLWLSNLFYIIYINTCMVFFFTGKSGEDVYYCLWVILYNLQKSFFALWFSELIWKFNLDWSIIKWWRNCN